MVMGLRLLRHGVFQILEVVHHPGATSENLAMSDSTGSREEEERHQALLAENEQLKRQITEVKQHMNQFLMVVQEIESSITLCDSMYREISLLYKAGDREDIKNWFPITLHNIDYKKVFAEHLKVVLPSVIHDDQNDDQNYGNSTT